MNHSPFIHAFSALGSCSAPAKALNASGESGAEQTHARGGIRILISDERRSNCGRRLVPVAATARKRERERGICLAVHLSLGESLASSNPEKSWPERSGRKLLLSSSSLSHLQVIERLSLLSLANATASLQLQTITWISAALQIKLWPMGPAKTTPPRLRYLQIGPLTLLLGPLFHSIPHTHTLTTATYRPLRLPVTDRSPVSHCWLPFSS